MPCSEGRGGGVGDGVGEEMLEQRSVVISETKILKRDIWRESWSKHNGKSDGGREMAVVRWTVGGKNAERRRIDVDVVVQVVVETCGGK